MDDGSYMISIWTEQASLDSTPTYYPHQDYHIIQRLFREGAQGPRSVIIVGIDTEAYVPEVAPVRLRQVGISTCAVHEAVTKAQSSQVIIRENINVTRNAPVSLTGFVHGPVETPRWSREFSFDLETLVWTLLVDYDTVVFASFRIRGHLDILQRGANFSLAPGVVLVDVQPTVMSRHRLGEKSDSLWAAATQHEGLDIPQAEMQLHNAGNNAYWALRNAAMAPPPPPCVLYWLVPRWQVEEHALTSSSRGSDDSSALGDTGAAAGVRDNPYGRLYTCSHSWVRAEFDVLEYYLCSNCTIA